MPPFILQNTHLPLHLSIARYSKLGAAALSSSQFFLSPAILLDPPREGPLWESGTPGNLIANGVGVPLLASWKPSPSARARVGDRGCIRGTWVHQDRL